MSERPAWIRHLRPSLAEVSVYDVPPADAEARLHANECPEPWPAEVMDALAEVVRGIELSRYPDTSGRGLRAILGARHGCDPDRIVLGNGSDEVIALLLTALSGEEGGKVVVPTPTFVMYGHTARVLGLRVVEVPLDLRFRLRPGAMHAALEGAALCFLARPNNPTGSLWDADVVRDLVAAHPEVVFVIDEAYGAYAPGSTLWSPDGPHNQVHMTTLSKVGLAALRVGYCIAHPELALALNKVRHPYNVSRTSLALAEAVLTRFADVQADMIERTIENRGRLARMLEELPGAEVFPSAGNLVLVRLVGAEEPRRFVEFLADRGVLVKDLSRVPALEGCVRVSVGTTAELDRLDDALAAWTLLR
jgi:histidinol-phosphate aminotransferase